MGNLFQYADSIGDGSGTKQATLDFDATPDTFMVKPPIDITYRLERMIVYIEDTQGFAAAGYGDIAAGLTNGITVKEYDGDDNVIFDLTAGLPVKTNADWSRLCYDAQILTWGVGNEFLVVRWTFARSGRPLEINGGNGEYLGIDFSDDMTGLVQHTFMVQGVY